MIRSKSGCAHIFLFTKKFIPAEEMQFVMKKFAARLGIADKMDRIYPIQTKFIKGGTGSWLNMPYFNHEEGSRYAYKDNFDSATLDEFFKMYEEYAQDNLEKYLAEEQITEEKIVKDKKIKRPAVLPCIDNCLKDNNGKIPKGMRNDFGYQAAWYLKKAYKEISKYEGTQRTALSLLSDFNTYKIDPPLEEKVITKLTEQHENTDYKPKCKVNCVKKYCDVSLCKRNPFGVDPEFAKELYAAEEILGTIYEYGSVPPIYYMYVKVKDKNDTLKDVRVKFIGSELKNKTKFLIKLHNFGYFPPKTLELMKSPDFNDLIDARLEKRQFIEASDEANDDFDFRLIIKDFLDKSTVSLEKWDMLEGACYYDQSKKLMHLRLERLHAYLNAIRKPMSSRELTFNLSKILKAKRNTGKAKHPELGQERSCPTWAYTENTENFVITYNSKEKPKEIEHEKN